MITSNSPARRPLWPALIAAASVSLAGCSSFGEDPSGSHLEQIASSPNYNREKEQFQNRRPELVAAMRERMSFWGMTWQFMTSDAVSKPAEALPEVHPDISAFMSPGQDVRFIWLGHSTILVNVAGKILLLDPVFSDNAAPVPFMVSRFQKPAISLTSLPPIDYVIITHDHYDHLDQQSIEFFKDQQTRFITPLGVSSHIKSWGIDAGRLHELDWWQSLQLDDLELICTPAQHFSGRTGMNGNKTLWASWVVRRVGHSLYFSGDSGYDTHFQEIGRRYGPFDVAFVENGQYNERWKEVHMMPAETIQAVQDLRSRKFVPIHWGMFVLALHDWYDPVEQSAAYAQKAGVEMLTPLLGQIVYTQRAGYLERWWRRYMPSALQPVSPD
ncbi:MAG: MBL fold metallo-hydrolase [Leptospiraceae bacterium]|nr:MBL fold metallo-hydrolase [Leptospiraceae bacterium]